MSARSLHYPPPPSTKERAGHYSPGTPFPELINRVTPHTEALRRKQPACIRPATYLPHNRTYNPESQLVTRHNTCKRHIFTKPVMQSGYIYILYIYTQNVPTKHPSCHTTGGDITKSPKLRRNSPCSPANGDKLSKFGQGHRPSKTTTSAKSTMVGDSSPQN